MPELPDLVYIEKHLSQHLPGKRVTQMTIKEPIVLRVLVEEGIEAALTNATFESVHRRGPFLRFSLDNERELVVHPMLAGRFRLAPAKTKRGRGLCVTWLLHDDTCLHYLDDKKMGKLYLVPAGAYEQIPRYLQQGVDILSEEFTLERFKSLFHGQRKQVRVFLMDQTCLSAIGNAYADEILFEARLHPKTFCYQLEDVQIKQLYDSIVSVMRWAIAAVEKAGQPIEVKVRDHLRVRNRKDTPCPCCGATIRRAGVLGHDTFFCPACQPPQRKQFIAWT